MGNSILCTAEHEGSVTAVGISEDGMKILAATASVRINYTCTLSIPVASKSVLICCSGSTCILSSCTITCDYMQGNIGVLDAASRSYATKMRSHTASVNSACLDSRGVHLITCSSDDTIRVWDTSSGEQVSEPLHIVQGCIQNFFWGGAVKSGWHEVHGTVHLSRESGESLPPVCNPVNSGEDVRGHLQWCVSYQQMD